MEKYKVFRRGGVAVLASIVAAGLAVGASAQQITLKIGHPLSPKTGLQVWAEYLHEGIEKRAPGKFKVQIFPASQLGAIPRMVEGAQLGTIEMIEVPPAFLSGVDSRFSVFAAPGIFDDIAHGQRTAHDPEFKKAFWSIGEAKGLKMVGMTCDAPSDYSSTTPIRKIADFRGLKLRVFGSKLEIETLRRLGATGVPMPLVEVISSIQRKAIDGNKAGITVFVPFKYQTVAKYVLKAKESIICVTKFASKIWYDRLPRDLQQVIMAAGEEADARVLPWTEALIERLYKIWVKTGGELNEFSPSEQAELRRRLSTVGDDVLKSRPAAYNVYKIMKAAAERTRHKM